MKNTNKCISNKTTIRKNEPTRFVFKKQNKSNENIMAKGGAVVYKTKRDSMSWISYYCALIYCEEELVLLVNQITS